MFSQARSCAENIKNLFLKSCVENILNLFLKVVLKIFEIYFSKVDKPARLIIRLSFGFVSDSFVFVKLNKKNKY